LTVVGIYISSVELDGEDAELDELEEEAIREEPTPDEL
jgi:hypothetical protein